MSARTFMRWSAGSFADSARSRPNPQRSILRREGIVFGAVFPVSVGIFSRPVRRKKWSPLIIARTEAEPFSDLVSLGPHTLIKNPTTPRLFIKGRGRHRMEMIDREPALGFKTVETRHPDHQSKRAVLIDQPKAPAWLALHLSDQFAQHIKGVFSHRGLSSYDGNASAQPRFDALTCVAYSMRCVGLQAVSSGRTRS